MDFNSFDSILLKRKKKDFVGLRTLEHADTLYSVLLFSQFHLTGIQLTQLLDIGEHRQMTLMHRNSRKMTFELSLPSGRFDTFFLHPEQRSHFRRLIGDIITEMWWLSKFRDKNFVEAVSN